MPIWVSSHYYNKTYSLGICLSLEFDTNKWFIHYNTRWNSTLIYQDIIDSNVNIINKWMYISIGFDDGILQTNIKNNAENINIYSPLLNITNNFLSGVSGIGSNWGDNIYFDNVTLQVNNKHVSSPNGSYILDCWVGNVTSNTFDGWVGFVLSMQNANKNLLIKQLGRFKMLNNNQKHEMNIVEVTKNNEYIFLLNQSLIIDLSKCITDLNGFCYTNTFKTPIKLHINQTYFILSKEINNGDYWVNMTNPATGTKGGNRDGNSYMTYLAPKKGSIIGRVLYNNFTNNVTITYEIDTSFGPLNIIVE
eukprot:48591_1